MNRFYPAHILSKGMYFIALLLYSKDKKPAFRHRSSLLMSTTSDMWDVGLKELCPSYTSSY